MDINYANQNPEALAGFHGGVILVVSGAEYMNESTKGVLSSYGDNVAYWTPNAMETPR